MREGIFAVWKPKGMTSYDVIRAIKKELPRGVKIGHAGTLDPLAQGVLIVAVGKDATRALQKEVKKEKEYVAEITLGAESETDDAEGPVREMSDIKPVSLQEIKKILFSFKGIISQIPSLYSAVKVKGKPAYARARRGEKLVLSPRKVEVKSLDVISYNWPCLTLKVATGPGVYIRAIARDLGRALGTGGYLSGLTRVRVGEYTKEQCQNVPFS